MSQPFISVVETLQEIQGAPGFEEANGIWFHQPNIKSVNPGARTVKEVESLLVAGGLEYFCTQGNELLQILGSKRQEMY